MQSRYLPSHFSGIPALRPHVSRAALLESEPPGQLSSHAPLRHEDHHDEDTLNKLILFQFQQLLYIYKALEVMELA